MLKPVHDVIIDDLGRPTIARRSHDETLPTGLKLTDRRLRVYQEDKVEAVFTVTHEAAAALRGLSEVVVILVTEEGALHSGAHVPLTIET